LGNNQTLLELLLHGPCRYIKYQIFPCNFSTECSIQTFFSPWICCAFKKSCYSSNISLFYENSSHIHCRQFLCHKNSDCV